MRSDSPIITPKMICSKVKMAASKENKSIAGASGNCGATKKANIIDTKIRERGVTAGLSNTGIDHKSAEKRTNGHQSVPIQLTKSVDVKESNELNQIPQVT